MNDFVDPAVQARNLVCFIGDQVAEIGKPLESINAESRDTYEAIGSPSGEFACKLLKELVDKGIVRGNVDVYNDSNLFNVDLTLEGWEWHFEHKRGKHSGNFGFIAMEFGQPDLESFVKEVVKPRIKEELGYELLDMRDNVDAGIIDNIMRNKIREAAFVLADLTHDNRGAYWEAGYAEGLMKPVIYICEEKKFKKSSTHFDTNHCTTIPWSKDRSNKEKENIFREKLISTLRCVLEKS